MNVLFVGPYRQNDDMGVSSRSYIKALSTKKDINLTTRPIYFSSNDPQFNDAIILEYENSLYDNYDVVIQQTPPHCLFLNKSYSKNIGLLSLETHNIKESSCISNINRMDEIWVCSHVEQQCLIKSGVIKPIKIISQPLDIDFIQNKEDKKIGFNSILDNMFKFYFIGKHSFKHNIIDLVIAFNLAFAYNENVSLVIKIDPNPPGSISLEEEIENTKKKLGISNKYKREIIITQPLSHKEIISLHNSCDCFVMPSYGESFCRQAAEALVLGKTPIVNQNTGMKDYINDSNGFLVKSHKIPVILDQKSLPVDFDLYNANEYWYKIDIYDLIDKMRTVFEMHKSKNELLKNKKDNGISCLSNFSYKAIGDKLCI